MTTDWRKLRNMTPDQLWLQWGLERAIALGVTPREWAASWLVTTQLLLPEGRSQGEPQERPNFYIAANFRYKYQAVKASQAVYALLQEDKALRPFFLRDLFPGPQGSRWHVAVFGLIPLPEKELRLREAMRAAKGVFVQLRADHLYDLLEAYSRESRNA